MKWEYMYIPFNHSLYNFAEELNKLGKEGWEAFTILKSGTYSNIYLKRKIYETE